MSDIEVALMGSDGNEYIDDLEAVFQDLGVASQRLSAEGSDRKGMFEFAEPVLWGLSAVGSVSAGVVANMVYAKLTERNKPTDEPATIQTTDTFIEIDDRKNGITIRIQHSEKRE